MKYDDYSLLKINVDRRVAFATIDHPPYNLMDMPLIMELDRFSKEVEADEGVRVVVVSSADPDIYIAHVDTHFIQDYPTELPPKATELNPINAMFDRFRTMPKATIAVIDGNSRGGGSEFMLAFDMRFASYRSIFGQPEVSGGIMTGGGGSQRLPRLIGRGQALEVLLGCCDIDAITAEKWGYINRAMPAKELTPFVEALAYRIATFPLYTIELMKKSVEDALRLPIEQGLLEEAHYFNQTMVTTEARERLIESLELGCQKSREDEILGWADKMVEAHAIKG